VFQSSNDVEHLGYLRAGQQREQLHQDRHLFVLLIVFFARYVSMSLQCFVADNHQLLVQLPRGYVILAISASSFSHTAQPCHPYFQKTMMQRLQISPPLSMRAER
jgi:hypothetical protein